MNNVVVNNTFELVEEVLKQFAEMFKTTFNPYTYKLVNLSNTISIDIHNHEDTVVLSIFEDCVIIKDVITECITTELLKQQIIDLEQKIKDSDSDLTRYFLTHNIENLKVQLACVSEYATFKYYQTEEENFQMCTIEDNILNMASTENIQTIKKIINTDLMKHWNL